MKFRFWGGGGKKESKCVKFGDKTNKKNVCVCDLAMSRSEAEI